MTVGGSRLNPTVSIVIVTFNSARTIERCLKSCQDQLLAAHEIIIIDNGSTDATIEVIERIILTSQWAAGERRLEKWPDNRGFAPAMNWGISRSHGDYVLCLNADLYLDAAYLAHIVPVMVRRPRIGAAIGKIYRFFPDEQIDTVGNYLNWRFTFVNSPQQNHFEIVFAANGCAPLYRRRMLGDIAIEGEYFDERFFAFVEDIDLAWRSQLLGWQACFIPHAIGWHHRSATFDGHAGFFSKPAAIQRLVLLNRYRMLLKNLPLGFWFLLSPYFLLTECAIWLILLLKKTINGQAFINIFSQLYMERAYWQVWRRQLIFKKRKSFVIFLRYMRIFF